MNKHPSRIDNALVLLILLCLGGIVMTYAWEFAQCLPAPPSEGE